MNAPQPQTLTPQERLSVAAILEMYRQGWFPMHQEGTSRVEWVQPHHRGLIPLDDRFHVSRSLAAKVRAGRLIVTHDAAFQRVVRACAQPAPGREDTWLHPDIILAFDLLHRAGHAHSIEAWLPGDGTPALVGGLYGLSLGSVFCGESMFSRPDLGGTDSSKVCLVHLVRHLRCRGFTMLDAQLSNEHLVQFGLYEVPQEEYIAHLEAHGDDDVRW